MTPLFYVLSYAALPLFGWWLAREVDELAARVAWAFLAGALLLTVEATIFSMAKVPWNWWALGVPLGLLSGLRSTRRKSPQAPLVIPGMARDLGAGGDPAACHPPAQVPRYARDDKQMIACDSLPLRQSAKSLSTRELRSRTPRAIIAIATLHFLFAILTTQAVSPDYLLFWGVKGVRFAMARGIDPTFLFSGYSPPQPDYPPLVPVVQGWGYLFTHDMPWLTGAAMSAAWLLAGALVIRWLLAQAGGSDYAAAFWTAAMALSFAATGCGGNAEAMLIAYLSVGAAAVVVGKERMSMLAFAGAALTKAEALFAIATILAGLALRELLLRDRAGIRRLAKYAAASAAGVGVWFAYQFRFGRELGFHRFTSVKQFYWSNLSVIAHEGLKNLAAGAWGLPWPLALGVVLFIAIRSPRRLLDALPLLIPVPLFFAFFIFLYLQYASGLSLQLAWTLGRISQPPLSFLLLGAAFLSARGGIESARHEP